MIGGGDIGGVSTGCGTSLGGGSITGDGPGIGGVGSGAGPGVVEGSGLGVMCIDGSSTRESLFITFPWFTRCAG